MLRKELGGWKADGRGEATPGTGRDRPGWGVRTFYTTCISILKYANPWRQWTNHRREQIDRNSWPNSSKCEENEHKSIIWGINGSMWWHPQKLPKDRSRTKCVDIRYRIVRTVKKMKRKRQKIIIMHQKSAIFDVKSESWRMVKRILFESIVCIFRSRIAQSVKKMKGKRQNR